MRLLEAIIDANHRAVSGDNQAGLHPGDYPESLPLVALTCIDPRLNPLLPAVLGLPAEQFIWLRNAGNIITGPVSSTLRSLALACAVKGGREIAIIGHTDCQVCKTSILELTERLRALGLDRARLPENLAEFFGVFASERQNVLKGSEITRSSPLIGTKVPVHGLLLDTQSGRIEWLVNGYETLPATAATAPTALNALSGFVGGKAADLLGGLAAFNVGEMKFPEGKIGEAGVKVGSALEWAAEKAQQIGEVAHYVEAAAEKVQARLAGPVRSQPAGKTPPPVAAQSHSARPGAIPMPPPIPRMIERPKGKPGKR